jgi:phage baseplate assembly protein W
LLTNPGDYLWDLDYGGGLGRFVGTPVDPATIEAVVRLQLGLETAIARTPAPQVSVEIADRTDGYVVANIIYSDLSSVSAQLNVIAR